MIFETTQIITLLIFLMVLIAALIFVKRFQPQLRAHLNTGKRINIIETTSLGGQDRAVLLSVDRADFLVVLSKRAGTSVTQVPSFEQEVR